MIVLVAVDAAPVVKSTVALSVMAEPPRVPVMVAVPAVVLEVSVAVYVPSLLSATAPSDPAVVLKATVPPEAVRLLLFASFN